MKKEATHEVTERRTPISIMLLCDCGWSHSESRRQNARGRAAKLNAATRRHWAQVLPAEEG